MATCPCRSVPQVLGEDAVCRGEAAASLSNQRTDGSRGGAAADAAQMMSLREKTTFTVCAFDCTKDDSSDLERHCGQSGPGRLSQKSLLTAWLWGWRRRRDAAAGNSTSSSRSPPERQSGAWFAPPTTRPLQHSRFMIPSHSEATEQHLEDFTRCLKLNS